jgi:phosphatidate cytidylyltransferase
VTRVLSGAVLVAVAIAVVWWAPTPLFFVVAELLLILAFVEYARLAAGSGYPIPVFASGIATVVASIGITSTFRAGDAVIGNAAALDAALLSGFVVLAAMSLLRAAPSASAGGPVARPASTTPEARVVGRDALGRAAASAFPLMYLGLPVGSMVALRTLRGREALFLLLLTVMVSDTAQYYSGRAFGRRLLAPSISPKKTVEGAIGGFLFGALLVAIAGRWWLPGTPAPLRALLGAALVAVGIAGDLFESMLKRSAGVKDSSALIPGHGGVLDRIDALLFAAPVYYIFLKYS